MGRIKENIERGMRVGAYVGGGFVLYGAWEYAHLPTADLKEKIIGTTLLATIGTLGLVANTLQIRDRR